MAARAIIRAGVEHKYWSKFPAETQADVEKEAKNVSPRSHSVPFSDTLASAGGTTTRTTFKQRISGAMKKKDQPE
jgi:hypothetical protein